MMKALKDVNRAFDLVWIAYLIRSSPQLNIFSNFCKRFNKNQYKRKKITRCF